MQQLTAPLQEDARQFMKDPVVAEFLQLPSNTDFTESQLKKAIIKHLRAFLLEFGRGFAFMYEQYHIFAVADGKKGRILCTPEGLSAWLYLIR